MELVVSDVLSVSPLLFRFMREDQAWLAMVVFACPLTPLYIHIHEHKAWMAAGAEHSHSHLDVVSRSSKVIKAPTSSHLLLLLFLCTVSPTLYYSAHF